MLVTECRASSDSVKDTQLPRARRLEFWLRASRRSIDLIHGKGGVIETRPRGQAAHTKMVRTKPTEEEETEPRMKFSDNNTLVASFS